MWKVVKMRAGPQISTFLAHNLHGSSKITTQCDANKEVSLMAGGVRKISTYVRLKAKLEISGPFPFLIFEDEMSIKKMVMYGRFGVLLIWLRCVVNPQRVVSIFPQQRDLSVTQTIFFCRWVSSKDKLMDFYGQKVDHKCVHNILIDVGGGEEGYGNIVDVFEKHIKVGYARILMANPLHEALLLCWWLQCVHVTPFML